MVQSFSRCDLSRAAESHDSNRFLRIIPLDRSATVTGGMLISQGGGELKICYSTIPSTMKLVWSQPGLNPMLRDEKPPFNTAGHYSVEFFLVRKISWHFPSSVHFTVLQITWVLEQDVNYHRSVSSLSHFVDYILLKSRHVSITQDVLQGVYHIKGKVDN
jgi:hypothetical protein